MDDAKMTAMMITWRTPDYGLEFEFERISNDLYGLIYPGFWGCQSWCYVATGPDAAVFCQPLKDKNGSTGTSITNIWDLNFILAVSALEPISHRALYEYYFDDSKNGIARVAYRKVERGDPIHWTFTKSSFVDIVGRPEPDFANLDWGRAAARRCMGD
jgi:hypothetical protein